MNEVKAKKFLGQHFLTDENIAQIDALSDEILKLASALIEI